MRACVVVFSAKLMRRLPVHALGLPVNGSKIFAVLPNRWLIACIFCQGIRLIQSGAGLPLENPSLSTMQTNSARHLKRSDTMRANLNEE
jgi:hypothetical protein